MSNVTFPQVADPVATMLGQQILEGINAISEANETLLASESGETGVREIDKALKEYDAEAENADKDIVKARDRMNKAREAFKKAQEDARNLYRTNILGVEAVSESDVDEDSLKEATKEKRKVTMQAVALLTSYGEQNNLTEVVNWAKNLAIPQVGRQGASSVGAKKPRAYVSVNGTTHDSFGEAAKAVSTLLSSDNNKVEVSSPDLVTAWVEAGEGDSFEFQGLTVKVTPKETNKKAA